MAIIPTLGYPVQWPPPATGAQTLYSTIRTRIKSRVPELTEVYFKKTPRGAIFPFAVMNPISAIPTVTNTPNYWTNERVQITVLGIDDIQLDTLGQEAYQSLSPELPPLVFDNGYDMGRVPGMATTGDRPGAGPGGKTIYHFLFEYLFLVGKSLPTT